MDWKDLYQMLSAVFDIQSCLDITRTIWENDRWCASSRNQQTARYCAQLFQKAGLSQVELLPLEADGKTKYFDWSIPKAWDVEDATLCYESGEEITTYRENPCSVIMYSPATPAAGVTAQVIEPCRSEPENAHGKVLLVREPACDWVEFAQENGAVGILSDYIRIHPNVRNSRADLADEVMWMGMEAQTVFGFHLTPNQADQMRQRLASGPVWVYANVNSRHYEDACYTVSAALEGTDAAAPEILLYGHLYEPGANDNACGAAAIIHLSQILAEGIRRGRLPRQKNTIRFALGYECAGSMGYLAAHPKRQLLCAMAVDMVGTEQGDRACLGLYFDPMSNLSYADGALYALHKIAGAPQSQHIPFAVATDNILADPSLQCPTVALCAAPALSYHSSMDRPDRLEPDTLKRNALMAGTYAWGLATADEHTCLFLADALQELTAYWSFCGVHPRQKRLYKDACAMAIHSLENLKGDNAIVCGDFYTETAPEYAEAAERRIPKRTVPGCLKLVTDRYCVAWNRDLNIPLFWIDGHRNLWQIAYLSAVEKGRCKDQEIREELELLTGYFDCLAEKGYIFWL